jgi:hypothetical protein
MARREISARESGAALIAAVAAGAIMWFLFRAPETQSRASSDAGCAGSDAAVRLEECDGPRLTGAPRTRQPARPEARRAARLDELRSVHCDLARRVSDQARALPQRSKDFWGPRESVGECLNVAGLTLRTVDDGEFGGGLWFGAGRRNDACLLREPCNWDPDKAIATSLPVYALANTSMGIVAIGGLSHLGPRQGFLGTVEIANNRPRIASTLRLPAQPVAGAVDDDGTLVVVTGPRDSTDLHRAFVVDDDGALYQLECGERGWGVVESATWSDGGRT